MTSPVEPKADRKSWLAVIILTLLFCLVNITTLQMDTVRSGNDHRLSLISLYEITSMIGLFIATAIVPVWLSRFPLSQDNWRSKFPIYIAGFIIFTIVHVFIMVGLRSLIFPFLTEGSYHFGLFTLEPWLYEIRKDAMSFLLILSVFMISRQMAQLKLEADVARSDARDTGRLTLKSGGRTIFLNAEEILYAKSAGNYVEVYTEEGMHLARMTLSNLAALLQETGSDHLRIHRSCVVKRSIVREVVPTGDGEAKVHLKTGDVFPISRKHRHALIAA